MNIRDYHHVNERVSCVVSIVLNIALSILLLRDKNDFMRPYSRVLLQNCVFDFIYTVACACTEMQIEMTNGVIIFVANGFIKELPIFWHYAFIWLVLCTANMTLLVVPIEFVFRYMLICRNITLTTRQLVGLGFIVFTLSAFDSSLAILSLTGTSDHQISFGHLMSDPIWFNQSGKQVVFVGANHSNIFLILFLGVAGLYNVLSCGIILWLGFATFRTLRAAQHNMCAKTRNMQTQMNRILVAEACAVLFIINVPIGIMLATLFFKINIPGFGIFMSMVIVWIPLSNPIVTMLLVAQYRRTVVGWFRPNYRRNTVRDAQYHSTDAVTNKF